MKNRGKWRRAEEQLTKPQRVTVAEMLRDGYDVSAVMDRFGLTHKEQVLDFYADPTVSGSSPIDKSPVKLSFRTTFGEVVRDYIGKRNIDNQW